MKFRNYLSGYLMAGIASLAVVSYSNAETLFEAHFDFEAPDEGTPDEFLTFGPCLTSVVVSPRNPSSPPNSAIMTLDLSGGWGAGMTANAFEPMDFEDATISMKISASVDLSDKKPTVAFMLKDEDGTVARSNYGNMYAPSNVYGEFTLPVSKITQVEGAGADSSLDLEKIVSLGLFIYSEEGEGIVHFYIDDINVSR